MQNPQDSIKVWNPNKRILQIKSHLCDNYLYASIANFAV